MTTLPDPARFRAILGHYPTGVCVITSIDEDGSPIGMTVGTFTSVSLSPPLVAFFPDRGSETWPRIRSGRFCVNVLAEDQEAICQCFARRGADKFLNVSHRKSDAGLPIIDDVIAWIDCTLPADRNVHILPGLKTQRAIELQMDTPDRGRQRLDPGHHAVEVLDRNTRGIGVVLDLRLDNGIAFQPCAAGIHTLLDELKAAPMEYLHLPIPDDPRLRRIARELMADPGNRIPAGEWARRVCMSERNLFRLTLQATGMTFGRWCRQLQIMLALERLAGGEPVQTVAFDLGYESASSFITMFRKTLGLSPAKYIAARQSWS